MSERESKLGSDKYKSLYDRKIGSSKIQEETGANDYRFIVFLMHVEIIELYQYSKNKCRCFPLYRKADIEEDRNTGVFLKTNTC